MKFEPAYGFYYEYNNGVSFELPGYQRTKLQIDPYSVDMKYNFYEILTISTGITLSGPIFFNNDVDEQMGYIQTQASQSSRV